MQRRQRRARLLAAAAALMVLCWIALFAMLRNPKGDVPAPSEVLPDPTAPLNDQRAADNGRATATPRTGVDPEHRKAALAAFSRLNCAGCHALEGVGNPSRPLDGVGGHLDAKPLRERALGEGEAAADMSAGLRRRKAEVASDPDVPALLEYLSTSR